MSETTVVIVLMVGLSVVWFMVGLLFGMRLPRNPQRLGPKVPDPRSGPADLSSTVRRGVPEQRDRTYQEPGWAQTRSPEN